MVDALFPVWVYPYKKWKCPACWYVYDEELGDEKENLPPGTRFEDISECCIQQKIGVVQIVELPKKLEVVNGL